MAKRNPLSIVQLTKIDLAEVAATAVPFSCYTRVAAQAEVWI